MMKKRMLCAALALFLCLVFGGTALAGDVPAPAPTLTLEDDAALGEIVQGLTASKNPTSVEQIMPAAQTISNDGARILAAAEDAAVPSDAAVGTGMRLVWDEEEGLKSATFIVRGDVVGVGTLTISQLTRMSRALSGTEPLSPAALLAADFNGSGLVDIADLVAEARLLTGDEPSISDEERRAIIDAAVALQTDGGVYSADSFYVSYLRAGDTIYGMLPGQSAFYTDEATVRACGGSYEAMYQSLQMLPHPEYGYRTQLGVYTVNADMWVATGLCLANSVIDGQYAGEGGGLQYVVPDYESTLTLAETVDLHA